MDEHDERHADQQHQEAGTGVRHHDADGIQAERPQAAAGARLGHDGHGQELSEERWLQHEHAGGADLVRAVFDRALGVEALHDEVRWDQVVDGVQKGLVDDALQDVLRDRQHRQHAGDIKKEGERLGASSSPRFTTST